MKPLLVVLAAIVGGIGGLMTLHWFVATPIGSLNELVNPAIRPVDIAVPLTDSELAAAATAATVAARESFEAPAIRQSEPLEVPAAGPVPVGVSIPEIALDGSVLSVGLASDNELDVPGAELAGWYEHSSVPGQQGATVVAAHVDYDGREGLFFDLGLLSTGAVVELILDDGTVADYRVTSVILYDKTELPTDELFRSGGDHALHLVTCGGRFDREARSYVGNTVVTAEPLSSTA